jgi:lactoylglutathione lyase
MRYWDAYFGARKIPRRNELTSRPGRKAPMLRKIDCIMIRVPDVDVAAAYYTKVFGLSPKWGGDNMIGLVFPEPEVEIVLHSDAAIPSSVEVYYLVDDVVAAVTLFVADGCHVEVAPFDITVGKCAAIKDPFGTRLCLLDLTKGLRSNNLAG